MWPEHDVQIGPSVVARITIVNLTSESEPRELKHNVIKPDKVVLVLSEYDFPFL